MTKSVEMMLGVLSRNKKKGKVMDGHAQGVNKEAAFRWRVF